jgi:hypothetical protein
MLGYTTIRLIWAGSYHIECTVYLSTFVCLRGEIAFVSLRLPFASACIAALALSSLHIPSLSFRFHDLATTPGFLIL